MKPEVEVLKFEGLKGPLFCFSISDKLRFNLLALREQHSHQCATRLNIHQKILHRKGKANMLQNLWALIFISG